MHCWSVTNSVIVKTLNGHNMPKIIMQQNNIYLLFHQLHLDILMLLVHRL